MLPVGQDTEDTDEGQNPSPVTPVYRFPIRVSRTRELTLLRMRRLLRALGSSQAQYCRWTNWRLRDDLAANPGWTEHQWVDLLFENLAGLKES